VPAPPFGIRHHYAQLGLVEFTAPATFSGLGAAPEPTDCRLPFGNLVTLTSAGCCGCTLTVGPADVGGGATLPALIASLSKSSTASVCLKPGTYTLTTPIVLSGFDGFTLRGCGKGVVLQAESPPGAQFALGLIVTGETTSLTIEDIDLTIPYAPFTPSPGAFNGLPEANQQLMKAFSAGLTVAIGISSADAASLAVRRCSFNFGQAGSSNVFGAGIYSTGRADGFELTECSFSGTHLPDVAPFYDLSAGNQAQPPYQLLYGFLQVPSQHVGDVLGAAELVPQLHDAVIERCDFEGITIPVFSFAQIGTVRIDQNRVIDCYGAFWLISVNQLKWLIWFDNNVVGNSNLFAYFSLAGYAAIVDRTIAIALAMGRALPVEPPSAGSISVATRQIRPASTEMLNSAQSSFEAIRSAILQSTGVSQPEPDKATAGEAQSAVPNINFDPRAFVPGVVTIPTADPGTSVTMRLEVSNCQVDAVIANSYSGAGMVAIDLTGNYVRVLVHNNRIRTRFPMGETFVGWLYNEATVTGNIIANEVPSPSPLTFKAPATLSIFLAPAYAPCGIPAIAITGNVFIDPTALPPRPATLPADLTNWEVLNTVVDFIAPPVVASVSPNEGDAAGGTPVTITGTGFANASAVFFGSTAAAFTSQSDTSIQATSPPGAGTVDVTVTNVAGTSATSPSDQFTYIAIQAPVAAAKAAATASSSRASTAPKTPRSTPRTPSTSETRPMQRPDLTRGAEPDSGSQVG
jgi:hypothetical protein